MSETENKPQPITAADMLYYTLHDDGQTITITLRTRDAIDAIRHVARKWLALCGEVIATRKFRGSTPEQVEETSKAYAQWGDGLMQVTEQIAMESLQMQMDAEDREQNTIEA